MRRSSIITTLLLVLVIVGLVVALIVTNLPEKQEVADPNSNEQVVGEENVGDEKEEEAPTYLALDSEIARRMATILYPRNIEEYFYDIKMGSITIDDLENYQKLRLAYWNGASEKVEPSDDSNYSYMLKKEYVDASMKEIFGEADYTPADFMVDFIGYEYIEEKQAFYNRVGGGGGGPSSYPVTGVYKIEEYSDRYEVYSKYLFVAINTDVVNSQGVTLGLTLDVKDWRGHRSEVLDSYKDFESDELYANCPTFEELIAGVNVKAFAKPNLAENSGDGYLYDNRMKILSKYYDQASEYKHTFMKNEDGTYYWVKSEIIK
ncbi:MAG: hypothetical protein J6A15_06340 [Clostridia bacterium]|nr:hypothetical protein [Clostridia bacterium]